MHQHATDILALCNAIHMPAAVTECLQQVLTHSDFTEMTPLFNRMIAGEFSLYHEIDEQFCDEPQLPYLYLALFLNAALETRKKYEVRGIGMDIFYDTMGAFTRFVTDYKKTYGTYSFDRQHWAQRHINMTLFRIGALEFEFKPSLDTVVINGETLIQKNDPIVSIHIPSDAQLTKEACDDSYRRARKFIEEFYPKRAHDYFVCRTWLLSPDLKPLLGKTSKIATFQSYYTLYHSEESTQYKDWLFGPDATEIADYPETTSLQRTVKTHLLQGGSIRLGCGVIVP